MNDLRKTAMPLFLLIFLSFGISQATEVKTIHYQIKPVPVADRTNLEIYVRFKVASNDPFKIMLPTDCFGTPDIHRYVISFEAGAGASVENGKKEVERIVKPALDGTVLLRYILSFDPKVMDDYPYSPNTSSNYFHIAGCQWLLRIGDDDENTRFSVEIVDAPKEWKLYSSIERDAARFVTDSSYNDLKSSGIGGGSKSHSFDVGGKPVSVFVHDSFDIPTKEIFSAAERIVHLQRQWFEDYDQPFFNIAIAPRSGVTAGYAPKSNNAFFCFVRKEISRDALNVLLAHELFHYWLPGNIRIVQDIEHQDLKYEWLYEGFTDFFAQNILLEAGLITPEKYVALFNRNVLNIADNPHRSQTFADFVAAVKEKRFNSNYKKLSYYRGALIASNWDARIRRTGGKRDLSDFIQGLHNLAAKNKGKVSEKAFFEFAKGYGIDAKADLERYIVRGETIEVSPDTEIKNFKLTVVEYPLFSPGFSLEQTLKTRRISGVVENGAAYRAGLRDGMEFVSAKNANRSSNSWQSDRPLTIVVKINGQEREIEFFPHGRKEKLKRLHPRT